jgi:hypothetical protein
MPSILPTLTTALNDDSVTDTIVETQKENTTKKHFVFDFEAGEFAVDSMNRVVTTEDGEAILKGVVDKILNSERYHHLIYGNDYGSEMVDLIKQDYPPDVFESEIKRVVREALIYNPLIDDAQDVTVTHDGNAVYCEFTVIGSNGIYLNGRTEVVT